MHRLKSFKFLKFMKLLVLTHLIVECVGSNLLLLRDTQFSFAGLLLLLLLLFFGSVLTLIRTGKRGDSKKERRERRRFFFFFDWQGWGGKVFLEMDDLSLL